MNVELTEYERKARELFSTIDQDHAEIMVGKVFRSMYNSALTVDKIKLIAEAMGGFNIVDIQKTLTGLARKKILRSRMGCGGVRLYEVNY